MALDSSPVSLIRKRHLNSGIVLCTSQSLRKTEALLHSVWKRCKLDRKGKPGPDYSPLDLSGWFKLDKLMPGFTALPDAACFPPDRDTHNLSCIYPPKS